VHLFKTNILIFDVLYMFRTQRFIFMNSVVHTGMVYYVLHASV